MHCDYCDLAERERFICETPYWTVFLSFDQNYLGRCFIPLKRHCESLSDLSENEWKDFSLLVKKLEKAIKKAFNASMFNWTCLMNDAYKKKISKPHVHWHLKPRYDKSVEFAGEKFEDPDFGHHYNRNRRKVSKEVETKIFERIRECL